MSTVLPQHVAGPKADPGKGIAAVGLIVLSVIALSLGGCNANDLQIPQRLGPPGPIEAGQPSSGAPLVMGSGGTGPSPRQQVAASAGPQVGAGPLALGAAGEIARAGQPKTGTAAWALQGSASTTLLWQNTSSGDRGFWQLANGRPSGGWQPLTVVAPVWRIVCTADFNGDGATDLLWYNAAGGDFGFWLMNGTAPSAVGYVPLTVIAPPWQVVGCADVNQDAKPDLLWQNTTTGDLGFWLMTGNGLQTTGYVPLTTIDPVWRIAALADFSGDGKPDLLWQNLTTGARGFWTLNGTVPSSGWIPLTTISGSWSVRLAADVNADGWPDILWWNTSTGERGWWYMAGLVPASTGYVPLTTIANQWDVAGILVSVASPPTVSIAVSPSAAPPTTPVWVSWSSSGATSCVGTQTPSGNDSNGWTTIPKAVALSNGGLVFLPSQTSTFAIICSGPGGSTTGSATVTIVPPATLTIYVSGLPGGVAGNVSVTGPNGWSSNLSVTSTYTNLFAGSYSVTARSVTAGGTTYSPTVTPQTVAVSASSPGAVQVTYSAPPAGSTAPSLTAPAAGATGVSVTPTFSWTNVPGATLYWLMVASSPADMPTDVNATTCGACIVSGITDQLTYSVGTTFPRGGRSPTLNSGTTYYWKVQGFVLGGLQGPYSAVRSFTTAAGFRLSAFPLANRTAYTAVINSVFDHSMSAAYTADGVVVAYTGETGRQQYGSDYVSTINGARLYGYKNLSGSSFSVNGHYAGGGRPNYLYYEGHSGIDFRTTDQLASGKINVYAAAAGTAHWVPNSAYNTIKIDHAGGYTTHYLHLSQRLIADGAAVSAGQLIGVSGDSGVAGSPHLHFEVQLNGIPVDPYGWTGSGADPYTRAQSRVLW